MVEIFIGNTFPNYIVYLLYGITQCYVPPALTPARQASTRFAYPWGMEGWVDLGAGYIPRRFTYLQTVTYPITNH